MIVRAASRFRSVVSRPVAEKMPGLGGISTVGHLGVARERVRVHRAGAAEADEQEVARVVAALHRDQVQRVDHRRVRDLDDAVRRLDDVEAERLRAALLDRARARPRRRGRSRRRGSTRG